MKRRSMDRIRELGQNIWLDFFSRAIMDNGKLLELIEDFGVGGITSNPSIFETAISNSTAYDEDVHAISLEEVKDEDIFYKLAIKDIRRATDYFAPLYAQSGGTNGFVSLEVSPKLANDAERTIAQARSLWKSIGRKNAMIKIPGTKEGLHAIRKCTSEGININVTLLFGLTRYEEVADAFILGLEDRLKLDKPIDEIVSVASFFISRIDAAVDPLLEKNGLEELKGQVAIACAKKAYQNYKAIFSSQRFEKLKEKGGRPQRLLWASTTPKDPSFEDVKYVEALIGKDTISTITIDTLKAFGDHGWAENLLEDDLAKADEILRVIKEMKIDMDLIGESLLDEGLKKFNNAFEKLMSSIQRKKILASA